MSGNVLVTGGAGYIGSHACRALALAGYTPVAVDNLVGGHEWAVKWGPLESGDVRDAAFLDAVFAKYKPVAAMHFAAFIAVGESVADPAKYYENNVGGTLGLLAAMRRSGCMHSIFSSTAAVYGNPESIPMTELHPIAPINPYGHTKLMMEQVLQDYAAAYDMRHVIFRYFNAAGAAPDAGIGEAHDPETHLVPLAVLAALGKRPALKIFGNDYDTPDGTAIRDYVHVCDLADAHVLALKHLLDGGDSCEFNLGSEAGTSVMEVLQAVSRVAGKDVPFEMAPRRTGDASHLVASASKARAELGWQPKFDSIDRIVQTAWDWHKDS